MRLLLTAAVGVCVALASARPLPAQQPQTVPSEADAALPRVFLDCASRFCDFDFFRTEVTFVSYVRDRQDADVHLLVTTQPTGGGGTEFTLRFIGLRRLDGLSHTLRHVSRQSESEDQVRRGLLRVLRAGLVPYTVGSAAGEHLQISYTPPATPQAGSPAAPERDPWNYWTFTTGLNGFFNGEQRYSNMNLNASVSANRTTEAWKINLRANNSYSESNFEISPERTVTNIQRNYGAHALMVRSLGSRWSAGGRASATSSTFLNQALALRIAPAVEYNLFPYSESTRRAFTVQYSLGANHFDYRERTIFDRIEEQRVDQMLQLSLSLRQPWGTIHTSAQAAHYLDDVSQNRQQLGGSVSLRLLKGLQLNVGGSGERVRDQLYLPAGNRTPEEILLRQRQLSTSFRYFGSVGLSYTFGSIFNNVVNSRFGSTGGGSSSCFCF